MEQPLQNPTSPKRGANAIVGGRKVTKKLPENFFEKVLDLELQLKREFMMESLQELVNLYSVMLFFLKFIILNLDGNRIL
jgi:hypothetical protein